MYIKRTEDLRAGDLILFGGFEYEIRAIASFENLFIIYLTPPKDAVDTPFTISVGIPKGIEVMTS